jgi:hypothetical protein
LLALGWFGQHIFARIAEACRYTDRINDFVLKVTDAKISGKDSILRNNFQESGPTEEDKKYILSLSNEILNPPHDQSADKSVILDKNENVSNDTDNNNIIFECFSDEVN